MELLELSIGSHKVLKNVRIDLRGDNGESKSIIVFAGVNGSGKTSILEYISKKSRDIKFDAKGYLTLLTEFEKSKGEDRLLSEVKTLKLNNHLVRNLNRESGKSFADTYYDAYDDLKIVSEGRVDLFNSMLNAFEKRVIYLQTESFYYKDIKNLIFEYVDSFVYGKDEKPGVAYDKVRGIMNDIFQDFDLKFEFGSIKTGSSQDEERFNVYFRNSHSEKIKLSSLSTGEKELITKAFYLEVLKPMESIVLIDEPERSLHPKWQQKMINVYERLSKKYGCQFIIATHSPHVISSVNPDNVYILSTEGLLNESVVVQNLKEMQQHSLGLEPNRVLKEIMGVATLRLGDVESKINRLSGLLNRDNYENPEVTDLLEELTGLLGENDPFIIRANHRLLVLDRKRVLS